MGWINHPKPLRGPISRIHQQDAVRNYQALVEYFIYSNLFNLCRLNVIFNRIIIDVDSTNLFLEKLRDVINKRLNLNCFLREKIYFVPPYILKQWGVKFKTVILWKIRGTSYLPVTLVASNHRSTKVASVILLPPITINWYRTYIPTIWNPVFTSKR